MRIAIHVASNKDYRFIENTMSGFGHSVERYEKLKDIKEKYLIISMTKINIWTSLILKFKKVIVVVWVDKKRFDKHAKKVYELASGDLVLPVSGSDLNKAARNMLLAEAKQSRKKNK